MIKYSLGFMFTKDMKQVLLIKKKRPAWQVNKLNGIGGKNKENETTLECMVREFKEETGITTVKTDWKYLLSIYAKESYEVGVYYTIAQDVIMYQSMTDEVVGLYNVYELCNYNIIPNINWLTLMIISVEQNKERIIVY